MLPTAQRREGDLYLIAFLVSSLVILFSGRGICQDTTRTAVRIGDPIPKITFRHVSKWPSGKFSTEAISKPTILYFFSPGCKSSFSPLPRLNQLYLSRVADFDMLLIGIDRDNDIQRLYRQYKRKYDLRLPVVFDAMVADQYNIRGVPHAIWINKKGIVQAITNAVDEEYLLKFTNGLPFEFIDYSSEGKLNREKFNYNEPFLVNGNGGEAGDFVQRSLLAKWKVGMPMYMPWASGDKGPLEDLTYLQVLGRELSDLYRIAYFGTTFAWTSRDSLYGSYHFSPILEIEDEALFQSNYELGKNLFCYSQILPSDRRVPDQMMKVMQRDLENFFGYSATVETRKLPYLRLIASEKARKQLRTNGGLERFSSSLVHATLSNQPISKLIAFLTYHLNLTIKDLPLIDETGIKENIDLSLNAIMTDFEDVRNALQKHGLDMVIGEKPMKAIVIRDSP